jgi:uncharacterized protein YaaQ
MKLIIAIVRDVDAGPVVTRLVDDGYRVTRIASTGGFLRRGNVTLLIGIEAGQVDEVISRLRETCTPPEPGQYRATLFVVDATHFEQI